MTNEEEQILLKDLYARLPYRVKGRYCLYDSNGNLTDWGNEPEIIENIDLKKGKIWTDNTVQGYNLDEFKPFLRPVSSMMQGEWEEMTALIYPYGRVNRNPDNKNELLLWLSAERNGVMPIILINDVFSWLNAHHFDYRGLIEKGLAFEAHEGMYKEN